MIKCVLMILCGLVCSNLFSYAAADTLADKEAAKKLVAVAMEKVGQGKTQEGLLLLEPYLVIPKAEFDVLKSKIVMQTPLIEKRFGNTVGIELVEVEAAGQSLLLITYIQKLERHILRWKFYFYKPKDRWVLNTFRFDDKIKLMFDN